MLAPAGLNAALTGHGLMSTDSRAARILQEWSKFYPVLKDERSNGSIPCLVEIIHSDNKMLYPSSLVGVPVARTGICPYLCCLKGLRRVTTKPIAMGVSLQWAFHAIEIIVDG